MQKVIDQFNAIEDLKPTIAIIQNSYKFIKEVVNYHVGFEPDDMTNDCTVAIFRVKPRLIVTKSGNIENMKP